MTYNPNDPKDPLRHNYLARVDRSNERCVPIEEKIANGLGRPKPEPVAVIPVGYERDANGNNVIFRSISAAVRSLGG